MIWDGTRSLGGGGRLVRDEEVRVRAQRRAPGGCARFGS
jgi:hypothetical protein